jgi:DNA-binding transcriptional regulator PaaX
MNYNQLKLQILGLFGTTEELDSAQVLTLLGDHQAHTDKAVEMALLRYWRQGLLKRARKHGRYFYTLTERGLARKEWLRKTMESSGT